MPVAVDPDQSLLRFPADLVGCGLYLHLSYGGVFICSHRDCRRLLVGRSAATHVIRTHHSDTHKSSSIIESVVDAYIARFKLCSDCSASEPDVPAHPRSDIACGLLCSHRTQSTGPEDSYHAAADSSVFDARIAPTQPLEGASLSFDGWSCEICKAVYANRDSYKRSGCGKGQCNQRRNDNENGLGPGLSTPVYQTMWVAGKPKHIEVDRWILSAFHRAVTDYASRGATLDISRLHIARRILAPNPTNVHDPTLGFVVERPPLAPLTLIDAVMRQQRGLEARMASSGGVAAHVENPVWNVLGWNVAVAKFPGLVRNLTMPDPLSLTDTRSAEFVLRKEVRGLFMLLMEQAAKADIHDRKLLMADRTDTMTG